MLDKSSICEKYIKILGRGLTILKKDGSEDNVFAVLQSFWKGGKTHYEKALLPIGRVSSDFYYYVGPPSFDVRALTEDDIVICDGDKYFFIKTDVVKIGSRVQFYTGTLKRIWEADSNVFVRQN